MLKVKDENSVFVVVDMPIHSQQIAKFINLIENNLDKSILSKIEGVGTDQYGSFIVDFEEGHGLDFDSMQWTFHEATEELMQAFHIVDEEIYHMLEEGDFTPGEIISVYISALETAGYTDTKQDTLDNFVDYGHEYVDAIESAYAEVA